jgi:hypothetical protein
MGLIDSSMIPNQAQIKPALLALPTETMATIASAGDGGFSISFHTEGSTAA